MCFIYNKFFSKKIVRLKSIFSTAIHIWKSFISKSQHFTAKYFTYIAAVKIFRWFLKSRRTIVSRAIFTDTRNSWQLKLVSWFNRSIYENGCVCVATFSVIKKKKRCNVSRFSCQFYKLIFSSFLKRRGEKRIPGVCIWPSDVDVSGNWTCFLGNRLPVVEVFSDKRGLWHVVGLWVGVAFVSLLVAPLRELRHDVVAVVVGGWVTYLTTGTFKGNYMRRRYIVRWKKFSKIVTQKKWRKTWQINAIKFNVWKIEF